MNLVKTFSLGLALAFVCGVAIAQEEAAKSKSECSKECASTCTKCPSSGETVATSADDKKSCCGGCAVAKAMKNLPTMTYKVGKESTCCSESAAALAKKHDKPIHYVVNKKSFESKEKAYTALVETTEKFVNDFVTPKKCEASGTTSIAGSSCGCPMEAGKKAELVKKAISEVKMTYVVDGKECNCPNQAKALAAKSDKKTTFVVAGKESCCNLEARLNFAKAKYAAAVKALTATEKKAEAVGASS